MGTASSNLLRKQFDVNFFGLVDVTNAALPHMRARRSGTVILMDSRSSWAPEVEVSLRGAERYPNEELTWMYASRTERG